MSITTATVLHCEHDGCKQRISRDETGPRELRKDAKGMGWSRVAGKDFCSDHKPTYKRVLVPAS